MENQTEVSAKSNYESPNRTMVRASHILVDTQDEALKLKSDIESGKISFEDAAAKYSKCPSGRRSGGDLGGFGRGQMVKPFEDAAFSAPVGEITEPVKTQFGYHLIKVTATK
ncbi:MAG: peptidyl-prolyl cis-trans isomerase [bacterium]|nr:peptidyl-prolyl cis-trans isomerase [bacterium]